jgi:type III pantothenate kinase
MKLVIDIGNTFTKLAVFDKDRIVSIIAAENISLKLLSNLFIDYPQIDTAILASVIHFDEWLTNYLTNVVKLVVLDHHTPLPFRNNYETPKTLGRDRIAAVAGAIYLFPNKNILVIDAGTCITYDMVTSDKVYLGGGISPGINMRFDAVHTFTGKLPLIDPEQNDKVVLIGNTTKGSILSGVQNGILSEVDGIIERYKNQYPKLKIVVTGGDYKYFDKYLKNNIFAAPNLVLIGLKKILDFNEGN